jgi:uncharacterized protein YndB with AHSA1/START domain
MELRDSIVVDVPPDKAWDLWIDAARYPQWQGGLLAVTDLRGDVGMAGSSYVLEYGAKIRRQVTVTAAERPVRHVIEQTGMGAADLATTTFEPDGQGTRVTVVIHLRLNRLLRALSRLDRSSRQAKEMRAELQRFAAVAARVPPAVMVGRRYLLEAGPFRRHVAVIGMDADVVHVRLEPGWLRPNDPLDAPPQRPRPLPKDLRLWPINAPIRGSGSAIQHGLPFLLRDGGHGVAHLALSTSAWTDAAGVELDVARITDADESAIARWRSRRAPVIGVDPTVGLATLCTLRLCAGPSGETWAVAKVLRSEILRTHLAVGPGRWGSRPTNIGSLDDTAAATTVQPAVGHAPVQVSAFDAASPQFAGIVTLEEAEFQGIRYWREQKGGTFTTLEPLIAVPAPPDRTRPDPGQQS